MAKFCDCKQRNRQKSELVSPGQTYPELYADFQEWVWIPFHHPSRPRTVEPIGSRVLFFMVLTVYKVTLYH